MGLVGVATGVGGVLGHDRTRAVPGPGTANVDSEFRFFSAWYAAMGAVAINTAKVSPDTRRPTVAVLGAGWLLAASGRALASVRSGSPHPLFRVLGGVEAALGTAFLLAARKSE